MSSASLICIGLDLGTSALKAVAIDERCQIVAQAGLSYPTTAPQAGWAEQDPADWLNAARQALAQITAALPARCQVLAVGLAGQLPTLALLDLDGRALHPAIVWYDGRAEAQAQALLQHIPASEWYRRSGVILDAHYLAPMCLWVYEQHPAVAAQPHLICSARDALLHALTGEWATDPSTASGYGVFDPVAGAWDPLLCAAAGLDPSRLPRVAAPQTIVGALDALAGPLASVPVVTGAGDALAGVLGCGAAAPGILAAISGTSTSLVVSTDRPVFDPGCRYLLTPHAVPGIWGLEMDLLATGSSLRWLADLLNLRPGDLLDRAAFSPPGAHGVVALPYLAGGEQGALWDPNVPAAFIGFSLTSTGADLARALLEGMAFETRRCLDIWQEAGCGVKEVVLSGGLDHPIFAQLLANVLDLPVRVPHQIPASAYGAALLAGIGAAAWTAAEAQQTAQLHWSAPFTPDREVASRYKVLYAEYVGVSAVAREHLGERVR